MDFNNKIMRQNLWSLLIIHILSVCLVNGLNSRSIRFSRLESSLVVNSYHGEVRVTVDVGENAGQVTTQWKKVIPQEHYTKPITVDYTNSVYQSEWYDRQGKHTTAVYNPLPAIGQGQIEVIVTAMTGIRDLMIEKIFRPIIALYPSPVLKDIDAIEPTEFPYGLHSFVLGNPITLIYKFKAKGDVAHSVQFGALEDGGNYILNYQSIRQNDPAANVEVTSSFSDLDNDLKEHEVNVHIQNAKAHHEGRLKVKIMRAFQQTLNEEESVTFITDLTQTPRQSIFQGKSLQIQISACNSRFVSYDTTPIQVTMTQGLPNCVYCTVSGYPSPSSVEFFADGYPVSSGQYHSSFWYPKERDTLEAVFSIQHALGDFEGTYRCTAYSREDGRAINKDFEIVIQ